MILRSLKTKLIMATSLLIIIILTALSALFINNQTKNLTEDIYSNARNFAQLTAPQIAEINDLYLSEGSFLAFLKEMRLIFSKNTDIENISLYSYQGTVLYDSETEKSQQYSGIKREISDSQLLNQIQAQYVSIRSENNNLAYLKPNVHGELVLVDKDEKSISNFTSKEKIKAIVVPYDNRIAIEYDISYDSLLAQIQAMLAETLVVMVVGLIVAIVISYVLASRIVAPLKVLTQGALTIAQGDFSQQVNIKTKDEIGLLANSFNQMARQLSESTKAMVFQERVAKEFELAADIQRTILPTDVPIVDGIEIAAGLLPAEAIGGDLFDFIPVDEDNLMMYLGDVTGHGVPSSLVVSIANSVIFSHIEEKDMSKILTRTNAVLKAKTLPNMFLTLLMMNWNISAQKMTFVSAGHEQMIYYSAADKKVTLLPAGGMALGMVPDISKILKVQEVDLQSGDLLVTYSDGIPEAWKNEEEMYGMARFKQLVAQVANLSSSEAIKNAIIADVKLFTNGYEQKDDITVMVVKKS